jgi:2-amino-4-hydroxy-6-hydroxymethyldihydropteridine diphosphokinase
MGPMIAYVGLGSNLGPRRDHLRSGLVGLRAAGLDPLATSSICESEPVGSDDPRWFLNMAAALRADGDPLAILDVLLEIERKSGRVRTARNAPRTLDLDLLLLGDLRWSDDRLVLPHPRMWERRFVLEPLTEIAPDLRNADTGRTVAEECDRIRNRPAVCRVAGIIRFSTGSWRSASRHEIQIDRR